MLCRRKKFCGENTALQQKHQVSTLLLNGTEAIYRCATDRAVFVLLYHRFCTALATQAVATWHKDGAPYIIHADHTVCVIMLIKRRLLMHTKGSWLHILCLCFIARLHTYKQQLQLNDIGNLCCMNPSVQKISLVQQTASNI